ncbi:glycosyltransferase family 2 protein [Subtercola lobariae]|uniref:Glycosyl transferase n=1 Tax=Subtercola lobariae TaxID=1588641 RepID=A0A917B3K0_9MICO|nr:glycosyltransferase family 2 protein [Subtercola lobariae]GGF17257.1 glycosyl transferase [Subtercola lobariae]
MSGSGGDPAVEPGGEPLLDGSPVVDGEPLVDGAPVVDGEPLVDGAPLVDVVFPCLNEAAALPWVLGRLPAGYRGIVVDNGSTDDSAAVARAHGAIVVTEPHRGFGSAAHAGLLAATAPIVAFCDADASMDPAELPRLVALLGRTAVTAQTPAASDAQTPSAQNPSAQTPTTQTPATQTATTPADLVLGRRRPTTRGSWPLHARLANRALSQLIRLRAHIDLHDLGPMRAGRREQLVSLGIEDRRSGYPLEMVLRASAAGWRIVEVDTAYSPRVGRSKVTGTLRGTIVAIGDMSKLLAAVKREG